MKNMLANEKMTEEKKKLCSDLEFTVCKDGAGGKENWMITRKYFARLMERSGECDDVT